MDLKGSPCLPPKRRSYSFQSGLLPLPLGLLGRHPNPLFKGSRAVTKVYLEAEVLPLTSPGGGGRTAGQTGLPFSAAPT